MRTPTAREYEVLEILSTGADRVSGVSVRMGRPPHYDGLASSYLVQMFKSTDWLTRTLVPAAPGPTGHAGSYYVYGISEAGRAMLATRAVHA